MTDVDPVAELAAELVALRRQFSALATNQERTADTANRAVQGLDDLEEQLTVAAQKFSDAAQATPEEDPAPAPPPGPEPLDVVVLYAWVGDHISNWAQRKTVGSASDGFHWCPWWLEHPEAITRLWALRRAWLEAVTEPGAAMTAYFRDCFDPTMNALSSETGPFYGCSVDHHNNSPFLPSADPPWSENPAGGPE